MCPGPPEVTHSLTHLLNTYYEPNAVPDDGGKVADKRDKVPVLLELILLVGKSIINK